MLPLVDKTPVVDPLFVVAASEDADAVVEEAAEVDADDVDVDEEVDVEDEVVDVEVEDVEDVEELVTFRRKGSMTDMRGASTLLVLGSIENM